jgi:uncharacterized membrane protein
MTEPVRSRSLSIRLLALTTLSWAGVLPLAAWCRSVPEGGTAAVFTFLIYGVGSVICHQRPDRTFHFGAIPLPVCARCAGIYAGGAVVALAVLIGRRFPACSPRTARGWLATAAAPALLSLIYEWGSARTPSNSIRAATGVLIGAAVAAIVFAFLYDEASGVREPARKR